MKRLDLRDKQLGLCIINSITIHLYNYALISQELDLYVYIYIECFFVTIYNMIFSTMIVMLCDKMSSNNHHKVIITFNKNNFKEKKLQRII